MFRLRLVKENTKIDFMRQRFIAFAVTGVMIVGGAISIAIQHLNFGIDFAGGILIEVRFDAPPNLADLRSRIGAADVGEFSLQEFGDENDVLIRIERQQGDERAQMAAISKIRTVLGEAGVTYRRTEFVGPQVGRELVQAGILAMVLSLLGIAVYVWFRFEWQFGVGALVTTLHDIMSTLALFSVLQLEFNLSSVAAVLLVAGYSINDTVVVYDRIRENLRRYRRMSLLELINLSINETLSRTTMTSVSTLLALVALYLFGGPVIADFTFVMIFGILVGTYSSIFVAAPLLYYLPPLTMIEAAAESRP
jgi:preprotein translocase subunit SecF